MNTAKGLLSDIQKSPYKDRIIVVLDSVHNAGLRQTLVGMGVNNENIIVWPQNGIEYYYPPSIIDQIFGTGPEIILDGDRVTRNGISYTKAELAKKVCDEVGAHTSHHQEFQQRFLSRIDERLGLM